jgi:hypothetical protein
MALQRGRLPVCRNRRPSLHFFPSLLQNLNRLVSESDKLVALGLELARSNGCLLHTGAGSESVHDAGGGVRLQPLERV